MKMLFVAIIMVLLWPSVLPAQSGENGGGATNFVCPTDNPCLMTPINCSGAGCSQNSSQPQRRAWTRPVFDGTRLWVDMGDNFGGITFSQGLFWYQYQSKPPTSGGGGLGFTVESDCGERGSGHPNSGDLPTVIYNVAATMTAAITSTATTIPVSNTTKVVKVGNFNLSPGYSCAFASGLCPELPLVWIVDGTQDELVEYCGFDSTHIYLGNVSDTPCPTGGAAPGHGRGMEGTTPAAHNPLVIGGNQVINITGGCPAPQGAALKNAGMTQKILMYEPTVHPWRMEWGDTFSDPRGNFRYWRKGNGENGKPIFDFFYSPTDGVSVEIPNMGGQGETDGATEQDPVDRIFLTWGGGTITSGTVGNDTYVACFDDRTMATAAELRSLGCTATTGTFASVTHASSASITNDMLTLIANNTFAVGETLSLSGFTNANLTFLNGASITVATGTNTGQVVASLTHANVVSNADNGGTLTMTAGPCVTNGTCGQLYVWNQLTSSSAMPTACFGTRWDGHTCNIDGNPGPEQRHTHSLTWDSQDGVFVLFGGQNSYKGIGTSLNCAGPPPPYFDVTPSASYPAGSWTQSNCPSLPDDVWIYAPKGNNAMGGSGSWVQLTNAGDIPAPHQRPAIDYDSINHYLALWEGGWGGVMTTGEYDHGFYTMTISCTGGCSAPTGGTSTWVAVPVGFGLRSGLFNNSVQQPGVPWNQQYICAGGVCTDHCHTPTDPLFNMCDGGYEQLVFDSANKVHYYMDAFGGAGSSGGLSTLWQLPSSAISGAH
jgi:hypothetical protein